MRNKAVCIGIGATVLISGCAGSHSAQQFTRLKANVDLLEQRVSQLERASLRDASAAMPLAPELALGIAPTPQPTSAPSAPPQVKPSTKEIQQALKNAGFYQGALDGKIGPQTREAIREFQRVHGLKIDGVVGKQTWAALAPYRDLASSSDELNAAEPLK